MTHYLVVDGVSYGVYTNLDDAMSLVKEAPHLMIIPFDTEKVMVYNADKERIIQGENKIKKIAIDHLQDIVDNMRNSNEEQDNYSNQE